MLAVFTALASLNVCAETFTTELFQIPETLPPTAEPGSIQIEGDKLDLYLDRKMRASGNAEISKGDQHIYGDNIEYDVQNDELKVNGSARIDLGDSEIKGPALKMRLSESIGEMRDATVTMSNVVSGTGQKESLPHNDPNGYTQSKLLNTETILTDDPKLYQDSYREPAKPIGLEALPPVNNTSRGDAQMVFFEGQDKKRLKNARYTTCEAGVDDWYIKAKEIELNDYTQSGTAKNAYVEFKGVPILYTPWISFSLNNERKSGLLTPTIGSTTNTGFEAAVPYYINIAPDKDATVSTRYMSKRGLQLQGTFRYLGESYSGIDGVEYLDKDSSTDKRRYYANLSHNSTFGNGWSAGYNLEKVSDNQYFSDLSTRIINTSRVNLQQSTYVDYIGDIWHFNALAQKFQTLDGLSYTYEALPKLTLTADKEWDYVTTDLYSQYVYYDRNKQAPLEATGSRLVVYPSISAPFTQTYGFVTPKLGLHMTQYSLKNNDFIVNGATVTNNTDSRVLPILSVDSGLYFERDFDVLKNNNTKSGYTQTIEPRLFYVYIPNQNQDLLPVFDSGLSDLNQTTLFSENQFTGSDRINNANQLSLAFTSRIIDKDTGIERLSATIGQRYYFTDQNVTLPGGIKTSGIRSDIIGSVSATLSNKWNLDVSSQYNTDNGNFIRNNITTRYNPSPGHLFNFSYLYTKDIIEQFDVSGQWPLSPSWYGVGRYNYSLRDSKPIEAVAGLEYDAGCWQARAVIQRVETATAQANYGLFFQLELGGLASIGSNPLNLLRRDIPGYLSSSEIPNIYRQQNSNQ